MPQTVALSEYLHTAYRPDCDWVDGELLERSGGQFEHSALQAELIAFIRSKRDDWKVRVLPEPRIEVAPCKFRIPDVTIVSLDQGRTPIITNAPLVCIEIMSPDDAAIDLQDRCLEYLAMGAKAAWVFDPFKRRARNVGLNGWQMVNSESDEPVLKCGSIEIVPKRMFDLSAE